MLIGFGQSYRTMLFVSREQELTKNPRGLQSRCLCLLKTQEGLDPT